VSGKGRVYKRGVPLSPQEMANIHHSLESQSVEEVAEDLKLDLRTVKKYNGNSSYGVGGNHKFNQTIKDSIEKYIKNDPTLYLREIKQKLEDEEDIKISEGSISKYLHEHLKYSRKKVSRVCFYRTTPRVQGLRSDFRERIKQYYPYSFFYIDESFFNSIVMEVI